MTVITTEISGAFEIIAVIMSFGIVFFFSISVIYGIKYLRCKNDRLPSDFLVTFITIVGGIWAIIFSYIFVSTIINQSPVSDRFGLMFIRPTILMTGVGQALIQKSRYMHARLGEKLCQNKPQV